MKYGDASAVLRVLCSKAGPSVPLTGDEPVVSSRVVEIEVYRAVDRERLLGNLDAALSRRLRVYGTAGREPTQRSKPGAETRA